jgi:hypothetical protein|tara:strand:- start:1220 stop:1402 length:183 start_codon:yes stop_codon:yes gene_type:complete
MNSDEEKLLRKMMEKIDLLSKTIVEAYVEDIDGLQTMIPASKIIEMEEFMGFRITLMGMS